jgi:hypothetical protein
MEALKITKPHDLEGWRIKRVLAGIETVMKQSSDTYASIRSASAHDHRAFQEPENRFRLLEEFAHSIPHVLSSLVSKSIRATFSRCPFATENTPSLINAISTERPYNRMTVADVSYMVT